MARDGRAEFMGPRAALIYLTCIQTRPRPYTLTPLRRRRRRYDDYCGPIASGGMGDRPANLCVIGAALTIPLVDHRSFKWPFFHAQTPRFPLGVMCDMRRTSIAQAIMSNLVPPRTSDATTRRRHEAVFIKSYPTQPGQSVIPEITGTANNAQFPDRVTIHAMIMVIFWTEQVRVSSITIRKI